MDVSFYHWVFAVTFVAVFIIAVIYAYRADIKQSPAIFKGSWRFLAGVTLVIMILIVLKILSRFS